MCGIYVSCNRARFGKPSAELERLLALRGPDAGRKHDKNLPNNTDISRQCPKDNSWYLTFHSTVLSLRGQPITTQPLEDPETGSLLCWNGEAWASNGEDIIGNDARKVFELLLGAATRRDHPELGSGDSRQENMSRVGQVLHQITGPYAFVYLDAADLRLYYARDVLGRRSLLFHSCNECGIKLCSLADPQNMHEWEEVGANSIYVLDLAAEGMPNQHSIGFGETRSRLKYSKSEKIIPSLNQTTPPDLLPELTLSSTVVQELAARLYASLRTRVTNISSASFMPGNPSPLAILFSGGVDCTLLARLMHDIVSVEQDIDLLNVAFENPRVIRAAGKLSSDNPEGFSPFAQCPDRNTGLSALTELKQVCPTRTWRLVCIDVPYAEMAQHRSQIVSLMWPHNTEMDLSIAAALYFAARGRGHLLDDPKNSVYETTARVLISGLGADELFGGYTRHATAFKRHGYQGLADELQMDLSRLEKRNLGRDDRVISHWGREARYPYLDEDLIDWVLGLPVWHKCPFGEDNGSPDTSSTAAASTIDHEVDDTTETSPRLEPGKKLLRLLAWKLDMKRAASEKKRAIQFGARSAKMETGKTKGTQALS